MDPNQNSDQASQIPGTPQDDINAVPEPVVPEPSPAPEPTPVPAAEPEPAPASDVPAGTMGEVPPPPPVVEENPEAGQADSTQTPSSDINQAV